MNDLLVNYSFLQIYEDKNIFLPAIAGLASGQYKGTLIWYKNLNGAKIANFTGIGGIKGKIIFGIILYEIIFDYLKFLNYYNYYYNILLYLKFLIIFTQNAHIFRVDNIDFFAPGFRSKNEAKILKECSQI